MATTRRTIDHRLTVKTATAAIGGSLGFPSKMPGTSYGLPTYACGVGGKLRDVAESTCEKCYAHGRGNYQYSSVRTAQERRLASLSNLPAWIEGMTFKLNRVHASGELGDGAGWHRWHDSGDLISEEYLSAIVAVCEQTPTIQHWLPTREMSLLSRWLKAHDATLASMYASSRVNFFSLIRKSSVSWTAILAASVRSGSSPMVLQCVGVSARGHLRCMSLWSTN